MKKPSFVPPRIALFSASAAVIVALMTSSSSYATPPDPDRIPFKQVPPQYIRASTTTVSTSMLKQNGVEWIAYAFEHRKQSGRPMKKRAHAWWEASLFGGRTVSLMDIGAQARHDDLRLQIDDEMENQVSLMTKLKGQDSWSEPVPLGKGFVDIKKAYEKRTDSEGNYQIQYQLVIPPTITILQLRCYLKGKPPVDPDASYEKFEADDGFPPPPNPGAVD